MDTEGNVETMPPRSQEEHQQARQMGQGLGRTGELGSSDVTLAYANARMSSSRAVLSQHAPKISRLANNLA